MTGMKVIIRRQVGLLAGELDLSDHFWWAVTVDAPQGEMWVEFSFVLWDSDTSQALFEISLQLFKGGIRFDAQP